MENKADPMKFFAHVDKVVGALVSLGIHGPVENDTLKLVEVLTTDYYEYVQHTILYTDNIPRTETEAVIIHRYILTSRNGTKNRDVGRALDTSILTPRNRCQDGAKGGRGVSSGTVPDRSG